MGSVSVDRVATTSGLCSKTKEELIYFSQVFLIYIVVIACIINLSIKNEHETVWISLLCSSLGYLLPAPTVKERKNESLLHNPS